MTIIHVEYRESAARALGHLVREGWTPESAKKFVETGDVNVLEHTKMSRVQLHGTEGIEDIVVKALTEAKKKGRPQ